MCGGGLLYGHLVRVQGGWRKVTLNLSSLLLFRQLRKFSLEIGEVPVNMVVSLFQLFLRLNNDRPPLLCCEGFLGQVVVFVVSDNVR